MTRPIVYHIPVCPFSQRLEIMLALKGQSDAVDFRVVEGAGLLAEETRVSVFELPA